MDPRLRGDDDGLLAGGCANMPFALDIKQLGIASERQLWLA